jgi:anaerobic magnesium-protoporphyrin IX monomethyl ester cyclase
VRVLFVEPPKDVWFVMGDYLSPPLGILSLASYLQNRITNVDVRVLDCQAGKLGWKELEKQIDSLHPDVVAPSGLGTCNAYNVVRTTEIAKKANPSATTIVGGQHFTALAKESLEAYPEIDIVVRGEGEKTLEEIIKALEKQKPLSNVEGLSFRNEGKIFHTSNRPQIDNLDVLPFPAYHLVKEHMKEYYFTLMTGKDKPFAIIEGSRGCLHNCSYCSQWKFWRQTHRMKNPKRIVDEIEYLHKEYGTRFFWLADDNFTLGDRIDGICNEIIGRNLADNVEWFCQARSDTLVQNKERLAKMRKAGNIWILSGFDTPHSAIMDSFRRKGIDRTTAKKAVDLLRENEIFSQGMFIIGDRRESHESIEALREYADYLDPDIATFMTLTPFPGTEIYDEAKREGWIEDTNWTHYDMIHAIMPTEHLTKNEVQEELYECYRRFYGKWKRRYQGLFSKNEITKRTYQYLARKAILTGLQSLIGV